MESRFRALFSRKSASTTSHPQSQSRNNANNQRKSRFGTQSYDSAVPLNPPIQGSYPVAGNGLNVLNEINQARERRPSTSTAGYAEAPNVPRWREDVPERPRTAPHSGLPAGHLPTESTTTGRSWLGFKATPPPATLQRRSIDASRRHVPPPIPHAIKQVQTYQPKRRPEAGYIPNQTPTNSPQPAHVRTKSTASSRASYVDILDAHSTITRSRDALQDRVTASGIRGYGEDVADRNIVHFGGAEQFDLTSPQYSYMRRIYTPSRVKFSSGRDIASHHALLDSDGGGDDTPLYASPLAPRPSPSRLRPQSQSPSTRSRTSPRPGYAFPPRSDSKLTYDNGRGRDDVRGHDRRSRTISPTMVAAAIQEEPPSPNSRRQSIQSTQAAPPPIPERGKDRPLRQNIPSRQSSLSSHSRPNTLDNVLSSKQGVNFSKQQPIGADSHHTRSSPIANESRTRPRTSSVASPSHSPFATKRSSLYSRETKDEYDSQVATSSPAARTSRYSVDMDPTRRKPVSTSNNPRSSLIVEGASEAPSLEGIVDLSNTTDTEVITKQLPAVTHEYVTPKVHHVREEVIHREIHTHDVFHRIQPIIETEILPTRHYIQSPDGKTLIEVPADQIPGRTTNPSFQIVPTAGNKLRGSSDRSTHVGNLESRTEPVLSSTKNSVTRDGIPKTESVWRHPPTLETGGSVTGQTIPMYFDDDGYSDEYHDAENKNEVRGLTEEELLFRDSGYGSGGMLPGLEKLAQRPLKAGSMPGEWYDGDGGSGDDENVRSANDAATHSPRRKKEKERLRKAFEEEGVVGVEKGLKALSLH